MKSGDYLIFELGHDRFALSMDAIEQSVPLNTAKSKLAHLHLIDGGNRFDVDAEARNCLVVRTASEKVGLTVEHIEGVHHFAETDLQQPDSVFVEPTDPCVEGFFKDKDGEGLVIVLNPDRLDLARAA